MCQPATKGKRTNSFLSGAEPATKIIFVLIVALILLSSAFITSSHFHEDLMSRADCAICKSANDLSGGSKQEPLWLIPQEIVQTLSVILEINAVYTVFVYSLNNRAPPV